MKIPFNVPCYTGKEASYIKEAFDNQQFSGDGYFTKRVSRELESIFTAPKVLLTHSCTAALEMCAILLDLRPGDEIIMPSYTFVSTANAFVLRGAIPVFVDIDPFTQNINTDCIEQAITPKTKAIVAVHYAGISCDLVKLRQLADSYDLPLIEDAAQAIFASSHSKPLGSFGDLATVSFHETKNISCGEGGCLILNNTSFIERAEIIREKGTNRTLFFRGKVNKYNWVDIGSSYLPGEISAAFLCAQLENGKDITSKRLDIWHEYLKFFDSCPDVKGFKVMKVPTYSLHNAHMFYIISPDPVHRQKLIDHMRSHSISCVFHYVPLHSSPAGKEYATFVGDMHNTDRAGSCLLRLPLYPSLDISYTLESLKPFFTN